MEDRWINLKATQEDGANVTAGVPPTSGPQQEPPSKPSREQLMKVAEALKIRQWDQGDEDGFGGEYYIEAVRENALIKFWQEAQQHAEAPPVDLQDTSALRAYVEGLLPREKEAIRYEDVGWNACIEQVRESLNKALEGK